MVLRYDAGRGPLTALCLAPDDDCFVAGAADGSVVLFAPDPRRSITTRFNLADARPAGTPADALALPAPALLGPRTF